MYEKKKASTYLVAPAQNLQMGVPHILDLVVCSFGQSGRDGRPPERKKMKPNLVVSKRSVFRSSLLSEGKSLVPRKQIEETGSFHTCFPTFMQLDDGIIFLLSEIPSLGVRSQIVSPSEYATFSAPQETCKFVGQNPNN